MYNHLVSQFQLWYIQLKMIYWIDNHKIQQSWISSKSLRLQKNHFQCLKHSCWHSHMLWDFLLLWYWSSWRIVDIFRVFGVDGPGCGVVNMTDIGYTELLLFALGNLLKGCQFLLLKFILILLLGILKVFIFVILLPGCMIVMNILPLIFISLQNIPPYYPPPPPDILLV